MLLAPWRLGRKKHTEGVSLIWKLAPNTAEKASTRNSLEKKLSASYHILGKKKKTNRKSPPRRKKKNKEVRKYSRDN